MYLGYKGRTSLKHSHFFTYDEAGHSADHFHWDKPADLTGLSESLKMINEEVTDLLKGVMITSSIHADNILDEYMNSAQELETEHRKPKKNIVRACSEALNYAAAKCFNPQQVHRGLKESFYCPDEFGKRDVNTKLLITLLNGGKSVGSQVKFGKFYLIVDGREWGEDQSEPLQIPKLYMKFL